MPRIYHRTKIEERFWPKVLKNAAVSLFNRNLGLCWIWRGAASCGYGQIKGHRSTLWAHRVSYILHYGPIPKGLEIDHLCRVRLCVRPSHLEAVTSQENSLRGFGHAGRNARKTHCAKGHCFTIYVNKINGLVCRVCRPCQAESMRKRNHEK